VTAAQAQLPLEEREDGVTWHHTGGEAGEVQQGFFFFFFFLKSFIFCGGPLSSMTT
jgi:hypothetical protein